MNNVVSKRNVSVTVWLLGSNIFGIVKLHKSVDGLGLCGIQQESTPAKSKEVCRLVG